MKSDRRQTTLTALEPRTTDLITRGRDAFARGAWEEARSLFERSVRMQETPEAFEQLGWCGEWLNDGLLAIASREAAHRLYLARGDRNGAARAAAYLAMDLAEFRGDHAVAIGWLSRAERLVGNRHGTPEAALVLLMHAHIAINTDKDTARARRLSGEARSIATATGATDLEMVALALEGLACVGEGEVRGGMRLLDEATASATMGESTDLNAIGTTCCYLISACERVRDFARAVQWCDRMKEFCTAWRIDSLFAICRLQYGSVLMWRGDWASAERELTASRDALGRSRPALAGGATVRLGEMRRRQGRFEEAERLFLEVESHVLSLLGRASIAFDTGDVVSATELSERYLRRFIAEDRTERIAGLEMLIRCLVGSGDSERARIVNAELQAAAAFIGSESYTAAGRMAEGLVSFLDRNHPHALASFEDAVDLFARASMPFEEGRARMELAGALIRLGRTQRGREEARRALEVFRSLGASWEAERAASFLLWPEDAGRLPIQRRRGQVAGLTRREAEILRLIAEGQDNDRIASGLFLSVRTVERHISNIYLKMGVSGKAARAAAAAFALSTGLADPTR